MASSYLDEDACSLLFDAVEMNLDNKFWFAEKRRTYLPVQLLAGLVHCNEEGETPLTMAIKKGKNDSLNFIDDAMTFLSDKGFSLYKESPVMYVIAFNQLAHHLPVLELVQNFVKGVYNTDWLAIVVHILSESTSLNRQDKIIALELAGATLIIQSLRMYNLLHANETQMSSLGLQCWRLAMTLRYFPADGEPLLPKTPDVHIPSVASSVVFESAVEVMSMEELELLEEDFQLNCFSIHPDNVRLLLEKRMKIQALLVIRRICGKGSSYDHPKWYYVESLLEIAVDLTKEEIDQDSKLFMNICLLIMEEMTGCDPEIMLPSYLFDIFTTILVYVSSFFIKMLEKPPGSRGREELSYPNLLASTKFISTISIFFPKPAMLSAITFQELEPLSDFQKENLVENLGEISNFAELVFNLMVVLEFISPQMTSQEKQHLEEYYSNYIRNYFPDRTTAVLHVAVRYPFQVKTIKLILELGADPNAIDEKGRTPLHIFAEKEKLWLKETLPIFQALVDAGTHLDMAADNGETFLSLLKETLFRYHRIHHRINAPPYYESLLNTVFPLSCYCARVIRRHGIPFDEDRLPLHLQEFVSRHSAAQDSIDLPDSWP